MRTQNIVYLLSLAALTAVAPRATKAQEPTLVVPTAYLQDIALDFDQGINPFYCYFGARSASSPATIRVDSVTRVSSPAECAGNGLGFVSRVADPNFLGQALKGVITGMPRFLVVSAFYRTEDVEHNGKKVHVAHALSVIRGPEPLVARGSS
ncbi:MAG TPA: hypothetical protein VLN49_23160 [Gemmatimonadaceae bacterium]|nr:hypothetical protein [Gemmatimonadaceae bacterium]